jgi:hypothetical protein
MALQISEARMVTRPPEMRSGPTPARQDTMQGKEEAGGAGRWREKGKGGGSDLPWWREVLLFFVAVGC